MKKGKCGKHDMDEDIEEKYLDKNNKKETEK